MGPEVLEEETEPTEKKVFEVTPISWRGLEGSSGRKDSVVGPRATNLTAFHARNTIRQI